MKTPNEGDSITEHIFERREMEAVGHAGEAADVVRTKAGARHFVRVPAVRELAAHPALVRLAETFIGVVAMRPLLVHASSKAKDAQSRRVLRIEYATSVHLGTGIELAVG